MALVIFLHGAGQSPPIWQDIVSAMSPSQPMVAPWLKGLKPNESSRFDVDQAVEAIADTMEVRGVEKANLVGYGLGGLAALRMAATYPGKVAHLVLISTALVPSQKEINRQRTIVKLTPAALFHQVGKDQVLAGLDALEEASLSVDLSLVQSPILAVAAKDDIASCASASLLAHRLKATTQIQGTTASNLLQSEAASLAEQITNFCAAV